MATLERAIALAAEAHRGQTDKAGDPYILHPMRVMLRVQGETERIVAMLHDVVEDGGPEWTLERLRREGFTDAVVEAVDRLTKRDGEPYDALIERAAGDPIAQRVKLADLEDNLNLTRIADPAKNDRERAERYRRAYQRLRSTHTDDPHPA